MTDPLLLSPSPWSGHQAASPESPGPRPRMQSSFRRRSLP